MCSLNCIHGIQEPTILRRKPCQNKRFVAFFGIPHFTFSWNIRTMGFSRSCTWQHQDMLWHSLPNKAALQADLVTYGTALAVLDQAQQWQRALELLSELPRRGIQASCAAINSAMACCEPWTFWVQLQCGVMLWTGKAYWHWQKAEGQSWGCEPARAHSTPSKLNRGPSYKNKDLWRWW